jgi:hypothetical protein
MNSNEMNVLKEMARDYYRLPDSFRDIFAGPVESRLDRYGYLLRSLPALPDEPTNQFWMDE